MAPVVIAPVTAREIVELWTVVDSLPIIPVTLPVSIGNDVVCNSVFIEVDPLDANVDSDTPNVELDSTIPVVIPPTDVVPFANANVDSDPTIPVVIAPVTAREIVEFWTKVDSIPMIPVTLPVSSGNEVVCNSVFKTVEPLDAIVVSDTANVPVTARDEVVSDGNTLPVVTAPVPIVVDSFNNGDVSMVEIPVVTIELPIDVVSFDATVVSGEIGVSEEAMVEDDPLVNNSAIVD
jgi:hypothetical protein